MPVRYFTTAQLEERTGISAGTWRYWRYLGKGPAYEKFGHVIRYREDHFEAWERAHLVEPASA